MDVSQNPSSPFYLHPGENPGTVLVTPQLDGANYHSWSRAMKCALLSKNKFKFVNGDILEPTQEDGLYDAWERCNVMIISWITRTLTTHIAQSTVYIDKTKDLWEDLKERFSKHDHFRISDLLQEINSIKQGERNVSEYFTDSKSLWEELDSLRPIPVCTCNIKCNCKLVRTINEYRESERVMCFLKGLSEVYGTVKTQILLMEPLPSINRVFSLVLQQERQVNASSSIEIKSLINSTEQQQSRTYNRDNNRTYGWKYQGRGRGRNQGNQCTYCHKMNHIIDECYSKHGFSPWMKQRNAHAANVIENNESYMTENTASPQKQSNSNQTYIVIKSITSINV